MVGTTFDRWDPRPVSTSVVIGLLALAAVTAVVPVMALLLVLRGRKQRVAEEISARYDERLVPPELGQYRGGSGTYSSIRTTMWLVLTPDVLALHPLMSPPTIVSLDDVTGTRIEKSWRGHWNGRPVLVVTTTRGELGITVRDPAGWNAALRAAIR